MARVTVEDCILNVPNRFELVLLAAQRAKQISSGTPLTVDRDNDKDGVVALREIADVTIPVEQLRDSAINAFCRRQAVDLADRKAVAEDEMHMEVEQAFEEAAKHIGAGAQESEIEEAGMSFDGEDVSAED